MPKIFKKILGISVGIPPGVSTPLTPQGNSMPANTGLSPEQQAAWDLDKAALKAANLDLTQSQTQVKNMQGKLANRREEIAGLKTSVSGLSTDLAGKTKVAANRSGTIQTLSGKLASEGRRADNAVLNAVYSTSAAQASGSRSAEDAKKQGWMLAAGALAVSWFLFKKKIV